MKVFLVGTSFHQSYGGPAFTVSRLAQELAALDLQVGLWAPDGSQGLLESKSYEHNYTIVHGNLSEAWQSFGPADVIHDNGVWLPHNHQLASLARSSRVTRVVSTRGMLLPWCFQSKGWKKRIAWNLYQKRDLQAAAALHVTSADEAAAAAALGITVPSVKIPNGVDLPSLNKSATHMQATHTGSEAYIHTALFLGRLHPKKGIDLLLRAWAEVRPNNWRLRVVGPDESGYLAALRDLASQLKLNDEVMFLGPVSGASKEQQFQQAEVLILPSYSENFGVVIAEALAHQVPVITTTATPWSGLEDIGAGWICEPELVSLSCCLAAAINTSNAVRLYMGQRGRAHVAETLGWFSIAQQLKSLYVSLQPQL